LVSGLFGLNILRTNFKESYEIKLEKSYLKDKGVSRFDIFDESTIIFGSKHELWKYEYLKD